MCPAGGDDGAGFELCDDLAGAAAGLGVKRDNGLAAGGQRRPTDKINLATDAGVLAATQ